MKIPRFYIKLTKIIKTLNWDTILKNLTNNSYSLLKINKFITKNSKLKNNKNFKKKFIKIIQKVIWIDFKKINWIPLWVHKI